MTARLSLSHPWNNPANPFHVNQKVVHRASREVIVGWGNHDASAAGLRSPRGWYPIEVLHFPLRTPEQFERKAVTQWSAWLQSSRGPRPHQKATYDAYREGRLRGRYDSFVIDDAALERGCEEGTLTVDTRLRDALRALARGNPRRALIRPPATDPGQLVFPKPDLADEASSAADALVLAERDSSLTLWKLKTDVESLRRQVAVMEQSVSWRATTPLRASRTLLRRTGLG